jgi:putative glutamine amidotransferase
MNKPLIGITTDLEGEYLKLKHYYCGAITGAGGIPVLIPPVGKSLPYAKKIDGLLIPGGADLNPRYYHEEMSSNIRPVSEKRSDFEISLLKEVMRFRKPVLGICYGMQLINVVFGGTLYQDIDSCVKVEISHKKDYHMIVITENRLLKKGRFSVNSTHHQAIRKLGKHLSAFAYSTDRLIEGFYREGYPFLMGVQWHPERLPESELSAYLFNAFVKAARGGK